MQNQLVFSDSIYGEFWYSHFFKDEINDEYIIKFKKLWLKECVKNNIADAWLSFAKSTSNLPIDNSNIAENNSSESNKNTHSTYYISAVDPITGTPITYYIKDEEKIVSKIFSEITQQIQKSKIHTKGIISDQYLLSDDTILELYQNKIDFIIKLQDDSQLHLEMFRDHNNIKRRMSSALPAEGLYATTEFKEFFQNSAVNTYTNFYYNDIIAYEDNCTFYEKLQSYDSKTKEELEKNENFEIAAEFNNFMEIIHDEDGIKLQYKDEECKDVMESHGFYSIASTKDFGPEEVHRIYHIRDASETQLNIIDSQKVFNHHEISYNQSSQAKFLVCFIASIIRNEMMQVLNALDMKTDDFIEALDEIKIILKDDLYTASFNIRTELLPIFNILGLKQSSLILIANEYNARLIHPTKKQIRPFPATTTDSKKAMPH